MSQAAPCRCLRSLVAKSLSRKVAKSFRRCCQAALSLLGPVVEAARSLLRYSVGGRLEVPRINSEEEWGTEENYGSRGDEGLEGKTCCREKAGDCRTEGRTHGLRKLGPAGVAIYRPLITRPARDHLWKFPLWKFP